MIRGLPVKAPAWWPDAPPLGAGRAAIAGVTACFGVRQFARLERCIGTRRSSAGQCVLMKPRCHSGHDACFYLTSLVTSTPYLLNVVQAPFHIFPVPFRIYLFSSPRALAPLSAAPPRFLYLGCSDSRSAGEGKWRGSTARRRLHLG